MLGIILMIGAFILILLDKITWTECVAFMPFCVGLILVKDDFLNKVFFVSFLSPLFLSGCVTYDRCAEKYGVVSYDTLIIKKEIPVRIEVPVPADSLQTTIQLDSLNSLIAEHLYSNVDSASKLQILYWKDKYNRLQIKAYKPPETIVVDKLVPIKIPCPPSVLLIDNLTWYEKLWEGIKRYSVWLAIFELILLIILIKKR